MNAPSDEAAKHMVGKVERLATELERAGVESWRYAAANLRSLLEDYGELRKDKARIDALEVRPIGIAFSVMDSVWRVWDEDEEPEVVHEGATLREALDAALLTEAK